MRWEFSSTTSSKLDVRLYQHGYIFDGFYLEGFALSVNPPIRAQINLDEWFALFPTVEISRQSGSDRSE
jgi:hypothetical protein